MRVKGHVHKHPDLDPDHPWFWELEYVPREEDPYEYGSVATFGEAVQAVIQSGRTAQEHDGR